MEIYLLDDPSIDKRTVIQKAGTAAVNQKLGAVLMVDKVAQDEEVDYEIFEYGKLALVDTGAEWKVVVIVDEDQGRKLAEGIAQRLAGVIGWKTQFKTGGNGSDD